MATSQQAWNDSKLERGRPRMGKRVQLLLKRLFDVVASGALLVLLSPVFFILAALVKLTSPGPIFFRWHVIGQGGVPFVGYKFRTMVLGAERMREQLQAQNEMTGPFFKMARDPRVTPVGRVMRRFSLDELPQLWSILIGDMSLVGPRPTQVFEFEKLQEWQKRRVEVKPGAVSSWIVHGKTRDFDQMVNMDIDYIERWSLWTDINMLLKAIPYVVLGKNT